MYTKQQTQDGKLAVAVALSYYAIHETLTDLTLQWQGREEEMEDEEFLETDLSAAQEALYHAIENVPKAKDYAYHIKLYLAARGFNDKHVLTEAELQALFKAHAANDNQASPIITMGKSIRLYIQEEAESTLLIKLHDALKTTQSFTDLKPLSR